MDSENLQDLVDTYFFIRRGVLIIVCFLFTLCGSYLFLPMALNTVATLSHMDMSREEIAWTILTALNALVLGTISLLAVLTYKRKFFLPLFVIVGSALLGYLASMHYQAYTQGILTVITIVE